MIALLSMVNPQVDGGRGERCEIGLGLAEGQAQA